MPTSSQLSLFDVGAPRPVPRAPPAEPVPPAPAPPPPAVPEASNDLHVQASRLAGQLSQRLNMDVRLAVTDNRSTLISFRRRPRALVVRVHRMFLEAPVEIVDALARYAGLGDKPAGARLDAYIRANRVHLKPPTRSRRVKPEGLFHDLRGIFASLNARYFDGQIDAEIGWGRLTTKGRTHRSIRMGVYLQDDRLIRIHPALDRPEVPDFFVAFVVFHEMLHQAVPAQRGGSRSQHHGPEFRRRERAYPDYELAIAWEKKHLHQLLGYRTSRDCDLD